MNKYGKITIIGLKEKNNPKVLCRCDCGKEKMINVYHLKYGDVKSCGCFLKEKMSIEAKKRFSGKSPANSQDYCGQKIGCIYVLKRVQKDNYQSDYLVKCDCSNEFYIQMTNLRRGQYKKCRCDHQNKHLKTILQKMIHRCENQNCKDYRWYGGKGIKVCAEWKDFPIKFINWSLQNGYKKGLSIDRIDSYKDYSPENCQWISKNENARKSAIERWDLIHKV